MVIKMSIFRKVVLNFSRVRYFFCPEDRLGYVRVTFGLVRVPTDI